MPGFWGNRRSPDNAHSQLDAGGRVPAIRSSTSRTARPPGTPERWWQPVRKRRGTIVRAVASLGLVFAVEEAPEGGCLTRALGESIGSEADDLQSLREMVRDALLCHFEEAERPRVFRLHLVRDEVLAVRGCHVT